MTIADIIDTFEENTTRNTPVHESLQHFDALVKELYSKYSGKNTSLPAANIQRYAGALFLKYILSAKSLPDSKVMNPDAEVNTRKKIFMQGMRAYIHDQCMKIYAGLKPSDSGSDPEKTKYAFMFLESLNNDIMQYTPASLARKIIATDKSDDFKRGLITAVLDAFNRNVTLEGIGQILLREPSDMTARFKEYNGLIRNIDRYDMKNRDL